MFQPARRLPPASGRAQFSGFGDHHTTNSSRFLLLLFSPLCTTTYIPKDRLTCIMVN